MQSPTGIPGTRGTGSAAEERRAFQRYPADLEAPCRAVAGARADAWRGRVFNISTAGVGLVLDRRCEPGAVLAIDLPGAASGHPRTLLARVIHATPGPGGTWLVGGSFLRRLDAEALQAWGAGRTPPAGDDRGVWVRFPPEVSVLCQAHGDGAAEPWRARVLDRSPGGLGLLAPRPVREGAHLAVEFSAEGGQPPQRLLVRVAHLEEQTDGAWLLGCRFAGGPGEESQGALPPARPPAPSHPTDVPKPAPAHDPDLTRLCSAWPGLPGPIQVAILALAAAVS
jgi:PilZ domain